MIAHMPSGLQRQPDREAGSKLPRALSPEQMRVQRHASDLADAVRAVVGDRFGEIRIEPDGHILLTIMDISPTDDAAIHEIGRQHQVGDWLRTRRAEPAELLAWEQVRHELLRLQEEKPDVLMGHPTPDPGYRHPPFSITLAAYAADVAAQMHERFGAYVELSVGALPYPPPPSRIRRAAPLLAEIDPAVIHVGLIGTPTVVSGHTATHGLQLTNLSDASIDVQTNGHLTAEIIDPNSGRVVGGYTGGQLDMLIPFHVPPHAIARIPLLIGTASNEPALGYAIPPGEWAVRATLNFGDGRTLNTPVLPLTIIGRASR